MDDEGFIKAVVTGFVLEYGWEGRLYAYGTSNGAAMVQRLAVNGAMGFTGVSPSASQVNQPIKPLNTLFKPINNPLTTY